MKKRANNEGSVYANKDKDGKIISWTAQISTPTGKRVSKSFSTQRKANSWRIEQLRDIDLGDYLEPSDMPLESWWQKWIDIYKKRTVSQATLDTYKYALARLPEDFRKLPIGKITKQDVQLALNAISDAGGGYKTVKLTKTNLQVCLKQAQEDGMIKKNPALGTVLPKDDREEAVPLTAEEKAELLEKVLAPVRIRTNGEIDKHDENRQYVRDAILLIMNTGIRRQECVDLNGADWDGQMWLRVRGTKTEAADRTIPIMDPDTLKMLARRNVKGSAPLFATSNGNRINPKELLEYMWAETDHTVHELRHTFITDAARAGVRIEVLMSITGHADLETILKIYTHINEQDKMDAIAKICTGCKPVAN